MRNSTRAPDLLTTLQALSFLGLRLKVSGIVELIKGYQMIRDASYGNV